MELLVAAANESTGQSVRVIVVLLVSVAFGLACLTVWYWRFTNPKRRLVPIAAVSPTPAVPATVPIMPVPATVAAGPGTPFDSSAPNRSVLSAGDHLVKASHSIPIAEAWPTVELPIAKLLPPGPRSGHWFAPAVTGEVSLVSASTPVVEGQSFDTFDMQPPDPVVDVADHEDEPVNKPIDEPVCDLSDEPVDEVVAAADAMFAADASFAEMSFNPVDTVEIEGAQVIRPPQGGETSVLASAGETGEISLTSEQWEHLADAVLGVIGWGSLDNDDVLDEPEPSSLS